MKRQSRTKALFISMFAAFMCFTVLADSRYFGMQLIYFGVAGMFVLESWMIVSNMKKPAEVQDAPEDKAEPEKAQVLEPGETEDKPEPTIQAPERKPKNPKISTPCSMTARNTSIKNRYKFYKMHIKARKTIVLPCFFHSNIPKAEYYTVDNSAVIYIMY